MKTKKSICYHLKRKKPMFRKAVYPALAVLFFIPIFTSCNPENEQEPTTTVEEDKANIQTSFDRISTISQSFIDGDLYKFGEEFLDIHEEYHPYYNYYYVGTGNGDYLRDFYEQKAGGEYTRGNAYYNYVGPGGDYTQIYNYETNQYVYTYTPGQGNYMLYYEYNYVGEGNGNYTYVYERYVGQGNGDYVRTESGYGYYETSISDFVEELAEKLDGQLQFEQSGDDLRFNFAAYKGKYSWNKTSRSFDKTTNNAIIALFPSTKNGTTNDCEMAIAEYVDKVCNIEGDEVYLPTSANMYFKKNGTKLTGIELMADYSDYGIPKNATAKIYAKPLSVETKLTQETNSKFSASLSVTDETNLENNLSISCTASLNRNITNYEDFSDCEVNNIIFTITQSKLTIEGSIDIKTLNNSYNVSAEDINKCSNFKVLYNQNEIGQLRVEEIGDTYHLFIYYKDGTQENTSIYYDKLINDLEDIFEASGSAKIAGKRNGMHKSIILSPNKQL